MLFCSLLDGMSYIYDILDHPLKIISGTFKHRMRDFLLSTRYNIQYGYREAQL